MIKFIYRHITRSWSKTLLAMAVAMFFTLALAILQNTIINIETEIERVYAETIVNAEIRLYQQLRGTRRLAGDVVPYTRVQDVIDFGIVRDMYLEGSAMAYILSAGEEPDRMEILVGVEELQDLTGEFRGFLGRDDPFSMVVQYGPDEMDFVFDGTVPVVISQEQAQRFGLGDSIYILFYRPVVFHTGEWLNLPAKVIGIHDGSGLPAFVRQGAVIPLSAMAYMFGEVFAFYTFRFTIDPSFNHDLAELKEEIDVQMQWPRYPWREPLTIDIWDQELRLGAAVLEQHVLLLKSMYPIATTVSGIIGLMLAMLTMLQNAKNAAIMRVLGMSKWKIQLVLWLWYMIVCVIGSFVGFLPFMLLHVAIPYLIGAAFGAFIGSALVVNRTPLELLQVKG